MKKILALVLAVIMVMSMAACATSGNEGTTPAGSNPTPEKPQEITLKVWGPQEDQVDENGWLWKRLKAFEAAHPEYKITWELGVCSEGDAATMVTKDVSAAADVYMYANDQLGTLMNAEALAQLGGSYLEQVKTDNNATLQSTVTYSDGKVYGFPYTNNTWFMYYDKSVFTEEDVKSLDTMLTKGKVAFPMANSWYLWAFYAANGGTLFGANGIDASAGIQLGAGGTDVTKYLVNLVNNENFVYDQDNKLGLPGLRDGSVKAMFSGSWDAASVKEALGDNMGAVQLPTITINGEAKQLKSFAGSKAIGVNKQTKHMKAAMELAAFLSNVESQKLHYEMRGIIPAASVLANDDAVKSNIVAVAEANTMANTAVGQPVIPEMGNYWNPAGTMGGAIVNKDVTLDNAQEQTELFQDSLNKTGL